MAAALGVATPFCSCSAVPLFIGFVEAGIPIGVTFAFLISAPMVNEVALVLLLGLFGWRVALIYMSMGLIIAMLTGWIIGRLNMERQVEDWVYEIRMQKNTAALQGLTWQSRIDYALQAVRDIVGKVWPYIIAGIGVGAAIHGYVPEGMMAAIMGKQALVVGAPGGAYRRAHLFQRRGHHPGSPGPPGQRRGLGHGPGLHDVGDRHFAPGDHHPPEGLEAQADRGLCRGGGRGHYDRRFLVQRHSVRGVMTGKDITQIHLRGGLKVGLTGLAAALEEVKALQGCTEEEIAQTLLARLRVKNYIPASAETEYKKALLREYKKALGEEVPEERGPLSIKILGPGCASCTAVDATGDHRAFGAGPGRGRGACAGHERDRADGRYGHARAAHQRGGQGRGPEPHPGTFAKVAQGSGCL